MQHTGKAQRAAAERADLFATPWQYRGLVYELTKRDFNGRYRGSFGGIFRSFAQPLFLHAVRIVAFGHSEGEVGIFGKHRRVRLDAVRPVGRIPCLPGFLNRCATLINPIIVRWNSEREHAPFPGMRRPAIGATVQPTRTGRG